jgi:hypothetical protein
MPPQDRDGIMARRYKVANMPLSDRPKADNQNFSVNHRYTGVSLLWLFDRP